MLKIGLCVANKSVVICSSKDIIEVLKLEMKDFLCEPNSSYIINIDSSNSVFSKNLSDFKTTFFDTTNNNAEQPSLFKKQCSLDAKVYDISSVLFKQTISKSESFIDLLVFNFVSLRNAIRLCFMIWFDDLLAIHCSGLSKNNEGFLFAGPTAAGKSTCAKRLNEAGFDILNDEFIFLEKQSNNSVIMYGTPFGGDFSSSNKSVILKKAFFISKSLSNKIKSLSESEIFTETFKNNFLMMQIKMKEQPLLSKKIFNISKIMSNVNCYDLSLSLDEDIEDIIYE